MQSQTLRTCAIVVAVILLSVSLASPVSAGLKIQGAKYLNTVTPGETVTHQMTVSIRDTDQPVDILIDVAGFGQSGDMSYSTLSAADDTSPYSARSFISLDKSAFHLDPGQSETVTATIKVPSSARDGGRYALIYFHTKPVSTGGQMGFVTAITVPVMLISEGGKQNTAGAITGISVGEVVIGQPISVTTSFTNTGNIHYYGTLNTVTLLDESGQVLSKVSTTPSNSAVIPANTVNFILTPDVELPVGTYTVESEVALEDGTVLDKKSTTFAIEKPYVPPITEVCAAVSPSTATMIASPDNRYMISIPAGAVYSDVEVCLKPFDHSALNAPPQGAALGASAFRVDGLTGLLSKDATVTVSYSEDDLAAAGGKTSLLKIAVWDGANNKWQILPTTVDAAAGTMTAQTNLLGVMAVMSSSTTTGGAGATPLSPLPVLAGLAAAGILLTGARRRW